ncbi:3-deoxy-7-phosphoheptulonate synthase [Halomicronema hongdechloris C2206]|uniref:3-deoxy-7-phosphoheptulonate synthase n=2 Tax=Halomicronema hongdechloris TaxID=1209493 RepID=A0A1Z3HK43_9CYAN|nr:3-deoxy-7-phosphoheptulonate synthase [Halomicronema hongdechloris C2206]
MKDAKLTLKANPHHQSVVSITPTVAVGADDLLIVGGPCTVENLGQMTTVAQCLVPHGIQALRGGVYKPRTSPYSFQGSGDAGLDILAQIRCHHRVPVVTEVMAIHQIESMLDRVDMLQVGSRNMQNFDLLKALGEIEKPVLLKRGLAATLEEFVMAAEYIVSHGNPGIVLCERGIRSFDNYTRNVLDLGAVVALKQITHLPVIVDPSHAAGKRELVPALAKAAIAAGADGLIVECHPVPDQSISDARQALSLDDMVALVEQLRPIAAAVGRRIPAATTHGAALAA